MKPLISIIVPVYNVAAYIERCASSLMNQSYPNIEFIFVDDQTPDDSMSILQSVVFSFRHRVNQVKYVIHEQNRGLPAARNSGLAIAIGDYIFHCDADDWVMPTLVADMVSCITQQDADIVFADYYVAENGGQRIVKQDYPADAGNCISLMLRERMHGGVWNKLYKRTLFVDNGIVFPVGLDMWEDLRTNILLFSASNKIAYCDKALYYYNQENVGSISKGKIQKKLYQILTNTNEVIGFLQYKFAHKYDVDLVGLKLAAKQTLLFTTDLDNFKTWRLTYPETNSAILSMEQLPLHLRAIGYFSYRQWWLLIRLWIFCKRSVKWFR